MRNVTIRVQEDLIDTLDKEADERGSSRSEYIRDVLEGRHRVDTLEQEVEQLRERLDSREDRIDELETQLARRSQIEEKVDTLAKQQQSDNAPFFVQWWRWYKDGENE